MAADEAFKLAGNKQGFVYFWLDATLQRIP